MSTQFDYTYSDFLNGINIEKLRCEIREILTNPSNEFYVSAHGNNVSIFFEIGLSAGEISDLVGVINVHDAGIPITDVCISPETYPTLIVDNITITGNNAAGNVNLIDIHTIIKDDIDDTKEFRFQASNITTNTLREFIVPDANTTLVGTDVTQTLINKTMDDNSNNIISRELWIGSGSSSVSTYNANVPISGQALIATSGTTATWQNLSTGSQIIVKDENSNITATPHSSLNFTGLGIIASDGGSDTAIINVPGFTLNTLTPQVQYLTLGKNGTDINIVSNTDTHTINIPNANISSNGIVTTSMQTFTGAKVFTKPIPLLGFIGCTENSGTNVSSITLDKPSGTTPGDMLMVCYITVRNGFSRTNNSIPYTDSRAITTPPNGWVLIDTVTNETNYPRAIFIYIKPVIEGEPSDYTWSGIMPSPIQTYDAEVTGSFSGTTMTVSAVTSGTLTTGQTITGSGIPVSVTITEFITGSGGTGTYTISASLSLGTITVNATVPKTNFIVGGISTFNGAASFNIIDSKASHATPYSLSHSTPTIVTSTINTLLIGYFSMASVATSWSIDMGMTQSCSIGTGPSGSTPPQVIGESMVMGFKLQSAAGIVGPFTATASNDNDVGLTSLIALRQTTEAILTVQGAEGQATDLYNNRDFNGNILSGFNFKGELFIGGGDSDINSNIITFKTETPLLSQDYCLTIPSATTTVVGNNTTQTLTNKIINANDNTFTNISNAEIKIAAAISVEKLGDGTVNNTEFGYLNGVNSDIQLQIDGKSPTVHTHDASDTTSGVFDDARISQSSITQHVSAIDHDTTLNFVSNKHIDHSSVVLTAGIGLTGGGDITSSRTIDLDVNGLTEDATPDTSADFVMTYDDSALTHKKVLIANLGIGSSSAVMFDVYDNVGGQTVTSGTITLNLDTIRQNSGEFSLAADEITVSTTDTLMILFRVTTNVTTSNRSVSKCWLEKDGGGGYVIVDGSYGYMYNRQSPEGENTATVQLMLDISTGDKFRIRINRDNGDATIATKVDASGISFFSIGTNGAQGTAGTPGAPGSGTTLTIEEGGSSVTNTPHSTLDFDGTDFNITDNGDGSCTVGISSSSIFGSEFQQNSSESSSTTTSSTFQQKLRMTTSSLPIGTYRIAWAWEWNINSTSGDAEFQIELNDTTLLGTGRMESQDSLNYHPYCGFYYATSISGIQTIDIDYRVNSGGGTVTIRRARLEIWRIS